MTKKQQVMKSKDPEPDYPEFCIGFTKLCMNLSIKFIKLLFNLSKHTYKRIQVWLIWRQLKKDVKECAACKEYFDRREVE